MLTDERINEIADSDEITGDARYAFARAIEAEVLQAQGPGAFGMKIGSDQTVPEGEFKIVAPTPHALIPQPPAKQEAQKQVAKFLYDQFNGLGKVEWLPHPGPALQHGQLFYTTPQQPSPCQKCSSYAGMSWGGNNVYGDAGSINSVKEAVHYAGQVPEFKNIIQSMHAKVAELESCNENGVKASLLAAQLHEAKVAQQAALIEQCEKAQVRALAKLAAYVGVCNGDKELTGAVLPLLRESLAAIAAHKKGVAKND